MQPENTRGRFVQVFMAARALVSQTRSSFTGLTAGGRQRREDSPERLLKGMVCGLKRPVSGGGDRVQEHWVWNKPPPSLWPGPHISDWHGDTGPALSGLPGSSVSVIGEQRPHKCELLNLTLTQRLSCK